MNITDFMTNLKERYPQLIDRNAARSDIVDLVTHFSEHNISKIWDRFIDTYEKASPPMRATFYRIAYDLGIGKRSDHVTYFRCEKCDSTISLNSSGCPVCKIDTAEYKDQNGGTYTKSILQVKYAKRYPDDMIKVQPGCFKCDRYAANRQTGANCFDYGKTTVQEHKPQCKKCWCRLCCILEYERRENPHTYKNRRDEILKKISDLAEAKKMEDEK